MKIRFKYILSSLIFLSLIGIGDNIFIPYSDVKYVKETEWSTKAIPNEKVSRCCHFIQYFYVTVTNLNIKTWSNEYTNYYNQKVSVKLISQTKIFCNVGLINWIFNKLYIPRKSIENHYNSCKMTDLHTKYCLSCKVLHDVGINMCNYILKRKWINQQINSFDFSMELNDWQDGLDGGYT